MNAPIKWRDMKTAPRPEDYYPIFGYSKSWASSSYMKKIHWNCDAEPPTWCDEQGNELTESPEFWAPIPRPDDD